MSTPEPPAPTPSATTWDALRNSAIPDAWTLLRLEDVKHFTIRRGATPNSPIVRDIEQVAHAITSLHELLRDAMRFADSVAHRAANEGEEDSDAIILGDRIRVALALTATQGDDR